MSLVETPTRFYDPADPGVTAVTVYTVPVDALYAIVDVIQACDTSGSSSTWSLSVGTDGTTTRIFDTMSVSANDAVTYTGSVKSGIVVLAPGDFLQAIVANAARIYLTISGRVGRVEK